MQTIGTLFVVATPIGNLEDITLRALRVLKEVDLILCEDTRTTGKLLSHYDIKNKLVSFNSFSTHSKLEFVVKEILSGKNIALVSDAGTPTISDPGVLLTKYIYEKLESSIKVIPIPGPSALITALQASGVSVSEFTFLGFLPTKKGRETKFKFIAESPLPVVFYESTHRILKTLESLNKVCPHKKITIARELTKMFEEFIKGTAQEVYNQILEDKNRQKGEFVVIVDSD